MTRKIRKDYSQYRPSTCHPEKRHAAKGLCFECYRDQYPKAKRATCHPDKIAHAKGLCSACYITQLKKTNPTVALAQQENYNKWAALHGEQIRATARVYSKRPETRRKARVTKREETLSAFGLTFEDELRMLSDQSGTCGICNSMPVRAFDLDHCHTTGRVRGLLCGTCNKGLGLLGGHNCGCSGSVVLP